MLRFIEAEIGDSDCDDSLDERDVVTFVDDDEFDLITRDRKKLTR